MSFVLFGRRLICLTRNRQTFERCSINTAEYKCFSTTNKNSNGQSSSSGATGRESVFKKFAENVKKSGNKDDEELKDSLLKFEEKLTEFNQNESIKRTKEILSKAKDDVMKQNAAIVEDIKEKAGTIKKAVGTVTGKVGDTISAAAQPVKDLGEMIKPYVPDISESEVVKKVSKSASDVEEKILENTNVYRYGGFKNREQREKSRAKTAQASSPLDSTTAADSNTADGVKANPDAGEAVVLHKESKWANKWSNFVDNNRLLQKFFGAKRVYEDSNNIFIYFAREIKNSISDRFASMFSETETARAMKEIQVRDPSFHIEKFMKFATEQIVPEILDAFLAADLPTLRVWCSEAMYNMLKANFEAQLKPGHYMEGRVLDMRHLEVITAKLLDDTPVLVFSFNTQQISHICGPTGTIAEGVKDQIENVLYVMALAKQELPASGAHNPITQGWKLIELAIRDKNGSW